MRSNADDRFCPTGGAPELPPHTLRLTLGTLMGRLQRWGVPGFRSGSRWKQWVAAIGYTLIFVIVLSGIVAPDGLLVALGLLALAWVLLVTDAWHLRRRVPLFRSQDKRVVMAGWIGLAAVSLIVFGAVGQADEGRREKLPRSQNVDRARSAAASPTSPIDVAPPSATETVPLVATPTRETVTAATTPPSPQPTTSRPTPMPTPSPTPDDRPARLYELVVGAYRGTSKAFLVDGLTPASFKFDGQRVTVQTDWYPDDEAKDWAVGFCNTVATFRSEFGYTEVQVKGQRDRTLARSENRGRDRQGNPIIVCRKA